MSQSDRLSGLYEPFRAKTESILEEMNRWCEKHRPSCSCIVTEGYRSQTRQDQLYAQGRTAPGSKVTNAKVSNHTSCLAADFAKKIGSAVDWSDEEFWQYLGHCARARGLTWGGDWKSPVDKPHVEWPVKDALTYKRAREWRKTAGLG